MELGKDGAGEEDREVEVVKRWMKMEDRRRVEKKDMVMGMACS